MIIRTDPKLWEQVKKEIQGDKKWNARIAQQAVQEYKRRGGKYRGDKTKTSLHKWTKEDWTYVDGTKRYLPKKVIESLSESEKKIASRGKKIGVRKAYPKIVIQRMKQLGVL
jgi:hypothetical protein